MRERIPFSMNVFNCIPNDMTVERVNLFMSQNCGSNAILTSFANSFVASEIQVYGSIKIYSLWSFAWHNCTLISHVTLIFAYENWCFEAYSTFRCSHLNQTKAKPVNICSEVTTTTTAPTHKMSRITNTSNGNTGSRAKAKKWTEVWWLSRAFP